MATVEVHYVIQSCPVCQKKLLKVPEGSMLIGSPLIECPQCGHISRTDLRTEWYAYPNKWSVWALPPIIAGVMAIVPLLMQIDDPAVAVLMGVIGLLIGSGISLYNVTRIIESKRRMKDPQYLTVLLLCKLISAEDYNRFMGQSS